VVEFSGPRRRRRADAPAARGNRTTGGRAGRRVGRRAGGRRVSPPPPTETGATRNGVCGRGRRSPVAERTHLRGRGSRRPPWRTPPGPATVAVRLGGEGVLTSLAGGGGPGESSERVCCYFFCVSCCSVAFIMKAQGDR